MSFDPTAIANIGGGLISGMFGVSQQQKQLQAQKGLWRMQNAYNTPANQMKRLKAAGLNPALMYGKGVVGDTGNAKEMPKADFNPAGFAQSVASGGNLMNQAQLLASQKKLQNAQAYKNLAGGKLDFATKRRLNTLLNAELDDLKASKQQKDSVTALNNYQLEFQRKTGSLKGDFLGTMMKTFDININTPEGKAELKTKLYTLLAYRTFNQLAPALVKQLGDLVGRFFPKPKIPKGGDWKEMLNNMSDSDIQKMINSIFKN